jgi:hypothetical protein
MIRDSISKTCVEPTVSSSPPVTVRLAGLAVQAIEPLTSSTCAALLQDRRLLADELEEARKSMADTIGSALSRFDPATRRFLLTIKRSCFNGRDIGQHREKAEWGALDQLFPGLAESITILEERLRECEYAFTDRYARELARERHHVIGLIHDRRFLRGVALGRAGLVQKIHAQLLASGSPGLPPKPAKWEQSLLRFVTRAATKLSANSTLTAYALGSVQAHPSSGSFHFISSPRREISLVRADRPRVEQLQALFLKSPAVRESCLVAWNHSLEEPEAGQYRFLRSGHWTLDPESAAFRFVPPARMKVTLSNPVLNAARPLLRDGAVRYDRLLALLPDGKRAEGWEPAEPGIRSSLDELIDLGFLVLMPPWPAYEPWLEKTIGEFLRALPDTALLRTAAEAFENLVELEAGFSTSVRPEQAVAELEELFSGILETVAPGVKSEAPRTPRVSFFEDVFLEGAGYGEVGEEILRISPAAVREILSSARLASRFAGLFNHRHDILHTLAAWWRDHAPNRREIPFTEVATGFASLWKQYIVFHRTANQSATSTFDPLHSPALQRLLESRARLLEQSKELMRAAPAKDLLPTRQLAALLDRLPLRYAPLLGVCVFVQPVDPWGDSWVLNHLHEGTGRYLSRVTPVLREPLRRRLLDHLVASSAVDLGEEEADLLEVMNPWGNLVNAHLPQSGKVLDVQGLHLDLPPERKVRLVDLRIQADLDAEAFRLIDPSGCRLLPANLSSLADIWHPNLLRFLLAFGPGETRGVFPPAYSEEEDECKISHRLTCDHLVLRRRRWTFGMASLRSLVEGSSEPVAYRAINDWRSRHDLPNVVFYSERTYQGGLKPQFLDFSSPALCGLFASSLRRAQASSLSFEEALPSPLDFPLDAAMHRRGFELSIDSLAVDTMTGNSSAMVLDHSRETKSLRREEQHV